MRIAVIVLAVLFLLFGGLGMLMHALDARSTAPIGSIALLALGTGCFVSLARK
jgi:hypothetical protein